MFEPLLQQLGLSKNEAIIYEALLQQGQSSVAQICRVTQIHRRNAYDSLKRLSERGVVFEVLAGREHHYQAVHPQKFQEFLQEKQTRLQRALPHMISLYDTTPHPNEVYIYKGTEGWKNYLSDILRVGQPFYSLGAKGCWLDQRVSHFYPHFQSEFQRLALPAYHLFDTEVSTKCPEILTQVGPNFRLLPPHASTSCCVDVFGDHVVLLSSAVPGGFEHDFSFSVVINPQIATAMRTWFHLLYDSLPPHSSNGNAVGTITPSPS